jgi:hypothetical protein
VDVVGALSEFMRSCNLSTEKQKNKKTDGRNEEAKTKVDNARQGSRVHDNSHHMGTGR